eukprot:4152481-Pyramimonas_sp.AAC.1
MRTQYRASGPHRDLLRSSQWRSSHASPPAQYSRFVTSEGATPKVPVAQFACDSPTQQSVPWLHKELHR